MTQSLFSVRKTDDFVLAVHGIPLSILSFFPLFPVSLSLSYTPPFPVLTPREP